MSTFQLHFIDSLIQDRRAQLDFAGRFVPTQHDMDLVLVGRPGQDLEAGFSSVLNALAHQTVPVIGFGSFRQQVFLDIPANQAPPLHVLAYPDRRVAEQTEPPLLLKKIGLFSIPIIDSEVREAWGRTELPPLAERLAYYRLLLAETLVLLRLGRMSGESLRNEICHKLAYVSRHSAEEILISRHGWPLDRLLSFHDVEGAIRSQNLPNFLLEALHPEQQPFGELERYFYLVDAWMIRHVA